MIKGRPCFGGALHWTQSFKGFHEGASYRLGRSLWNSPEIYIKNLPIFYADRVTTPFLMMNNKLDGAVDPLYNFP